LEISWVEKRDLPVWVRGGGGGGRGQAEAVFVLFVVTVCSTFLELFHL